MVVGSFSFSNQTLLNSCFVNNLANQTPIVSQDARCQKIVPPLMRCGRPYNSPVTVGHTSSAVNEEPSNPVTIKPRNKGGRPRKNPQNNGNFFVMQFLLNYYLYTIFFTFKCSCYPYHNIYLTLFPVVDQSIPTNNTFQSSCETPINRTPSFDPNIDSCITKGNSLYFKTIFFNNASMYTYVRHKLTPTYIIVSVTFNRSSHTIYQSTTCSNHPFQQWSWIIISYLYNS